MTATAVTSVCADPATVLICVNTSSSLYHPLTNSLRFCVNLLRINQVRLSGVFSGQLKGSERFSNGDWIEGVYALPFLADAQANLFCRVERKMIHSTHGIFLGRVTDVRMAEGIEPLLYQNGRYARSEYLDDAHA